MTYNQFYLAANIPQWGIFAGIVCVIIGYIDKKERWITAGWIVLIATGLISLSFNLAGIIHEQRDERINTLITAGWQCATGAALAAISWLFQRTKNRYFRFLAILTVLYFMLVFFQFNHILRSKPKAKPTVEYQDQTNRAQSQTVNSKGTEFQKLMVSGG